MLNLISNKKYKIYIKAITLMIAFVFLFENIGYSFLDIPRNKTTLRAPLASSIREGKERFKHVLLYEIKNILGNVVRVDKEKDLEFYGEIRKALLLENGKIVLDEELYSKYTSQDLAQEEAAVQVIIHELIEALLQITKEKDVLRYRSIKEMALNHLVEPYRKTPQGQNTYEDEVLVNDIWALIFEYKLMGIDPETIGDINLKNILLKGYEIINARGDLFGEDFNSLYHAKEVVLDGLRKGIRFSKAGEAKSAASTDTASSGQKPGRSIFRIHPNGETYEIAETNGKYIVFTTEDGKITYLAPEDIPALIKSFISNRDKLVVNDMVEWLELPKEMLEDREVLEAIEKTDIKPPKGSLVSEELMKLFIGEGCALEVRNKIRSIVFEIAMKQILTTQSAGNIALPVGLEPITVWVPLSGKDIEERDCPICGSQQGTILAFNVINGQRLPIIRCAQDNMVFLALTPNEKWWEKVYNDPAYFNSNVGMGAQNHPFGYPIGEYQTPRHEVDAKIRMDEVESFRQGRRGYLLDVGAGYGYLLKEAKDRGWKVAGVELNREAIQRLRAQEINTIETKWESAEITPQSVDVLTFYDMLEHFKDPSAALKKAKLVLKDDGLLVIRVPDLSNLTPENARMLLRIAREHVSYFSKATLQTLLVQNGYEIISIIPSGHQVIDDVIYMSTTIIARKTEAVTGLKQRTVVARNEVRSIISMVTNENIRKEIAAIVANDEVWQNLRTHYPDILAVLAKALPFLEGDKKSKLKEIAVIEAHLEQALFSELMADASSKELLFDRLEKFFNLTISKVTEDIRSKLLMESEFVSLFSRDELDSIFTENRRKLQETIIATITERSAINRDYLEDFLTIGLDIQGLSSDRRFCIGYERFSEIANLKIHGFELPEIVHGLDSATISADRLPNVVFLYRLGYDEMTFARQGGKHKNGNILISHDTALLEQGSAPIYKVTSALYYDEKGKSYWVTFKEPIEVHYMILPGKHSLNLENKGGLPVPYSQRAIENSYNKTRYPEIFRDRVLMPKQINWYREETRQQKDEAAAKDKIRERLRVFIEKRQFTEIIVKPNVLSGGRKIEIFDIKRQLEDAVEYIYSLSREDDVVIQEFVFIPIEEFISREKLCERIMTHPFFPQERKEAMAARIKRGDRILWNIRTIVTRNKDGEKIIPVRQVQINVGAVPNLYQGAVPFLIEDLFRDTDLPIDALLENSLAVAEAVDSYQAEQMDCYLLDFVVGPQKEAVFIEYNIGVGTYWNYEELLRLLSPDHAGEGVDPFIENAIRRGRDYKKRREEERFNAAQANIIELFSRLQAAIDPMEQEKLKQNLEAVIGELHRAVPQDKIDEIRELGRRINQGEDIIEDLYNQLSAILCLDLLKQIEVRYDSWMMRDGKFMNADQHNREAMNAFKLLGWTDEDEAYSYFNGRREQGETPLNHRNFSEIQSMFKTFLVGPEAAFALALTYALHDYGRMVSIGEHPEYGARLARSLLERLVAPEYVEQIVNDIEEHASLSRIINGEASVRKVKGILAKEEGMGKRQTVLRFIDASSVGQGRVKNSYLEDVEIYRNEYWSKLAANWGKARILCSIRYSGQAEIKLEDIAEKGIDKAFDDYVVQFAQDVWKEIEALGLTREFLDFLKDIDFLYAANIHRRLDIRSFTKWLFIMFVMHKANQSKADTIQYASDLRIEDVLRYVNAPLAITEIYNSIQVTESDAIKKVKLPYGLIATIAANGNILMIGNETILAQKPLSSEGLTVEKIKAQINGQGELKELSNEELRILADQFMPKTQAQDPKFKETFPNFEDELNVIKSILRGGTHPGRAPPELKFYQLKEPLKDKDGLPINAITYQEGDILNIYITSNNPIGLFHELYEHVILERNPNAHTLATVLESAFSDTILTQRAIDQLTKMTIEQLIAFIDKYEDVKREIAQKFQEEPLINYILFFAEAVNIEAKRIKEIKAETVLPLQGAALSKNAVAILKEAMESELSHDDREYLTSLLEFMPTNLDNLGKYIVPTLLLYKNEKLIDVNTKFLDAGSGIGIVVLYFALKFGVKSYGVELDERQHQIAERLKRYLVNKGYISDEQVVFINDDIRNIDFRPFSIVYFHDPLTSTELEEAVYKKASDEMQTGSQLIQRIPPLIDITLEEQFDLAETVRVAEEGKSTWANIYTKKSTLSVMQAIKAKPAEIAKDLTKQPISDFSQVVGLLSEAIPDKELSDVQEVSLGHIARYVANLLKKGELYYTDLSKVSAIVKRFDMKIDYKDLDGVDLKKFKLWVVGLIAQNPEIFAAVIEELLRHWDLGAYPILMEHIRQAYPDKYEKFLKYAEPELRRFLIRDYLEEKLSAANIDLSEIKKKKQQDFLKKVLGEISADALPEYYFRIATYKIEHPEVTPEEIAKKFSKSRTRINQMLFGYYRKDRKKYTSGILEIISDYIAEEYPDEYKSILKEMDSFLMRNLLPLVLEGGVKCEPIKVDEIAWLIKMVEELENSLSEEKKKLLLYKLQNPAKSQYDIADDLKISQNAVSGRLSGGPIRILTDKEDIEAMRLLFENDVAGRLYPEPLPVAAQHLPLEGLRLGAFLYLGMSPSKVWALPADSIRVELLAVEKPKKAAKRIVKTTIVVPDVEFDRVWANNWHWSMKINELLTELHKIKTKELPLGKEDIAWLKTALSVLYVKFHKTEFTLGLFEGAISKAEDCSDIKEAKKIILEFVDKLIGSFSNIPQDSDIRTLVVYELSSEAKKLEEDMQNGHFLEQAMRAIKKVNPALTIPEEVTKLYPYISAIEISLLAMVDNIPEVFFEKDSGFEIIEIQEDGVIFGSRKGEQFIQWKSEYKNGVNELIDAQRKKYFSQHVDYQHGNDLSLAFDELRKAYEQEPWGKILKERGNYLIASALNGEQAAFIDRGYHSAWGTSEMADIENNLFSHNIVSDQTTVMILGLLEYFPRILAEKDFPSRLGRLGWYWYPRKDGIVFVERLTGKEEFVPYTKDRIILPVLDRLSKIEKFSRQSFLNELDEKTLTLAVTPYDKARASIQRTNNRIALVYDNYWVVQDIVFQRKQKPDEIQTERFNFVDLYLIEQTLSLVSDSLDDVKDIYYPYQPLDDSFQSNRSFNIPDCYKHNANFLITHLGAGKAARLQAALLSKEIEKYLKDFDPEVLWVIASMRTILHEKAHRIWKNLSYLEQETYGKISWKWRKGKSEDATRNREKHFLFKYLTPEEDSFEEDFCDHFAAFILFGPQFAQESEKNEPIAVKLHFFQEKIFQGKPSAISNNPDFKQIYQGLPSVTIATTESIAKLTPVLFDGRAVFEEGRLKEDRLKKLEGNINGLDSNEFPLVAVNSENEKEEIEKNIQTSKKIVYVVLGNLKQDEMRDFSALLTNCQDGKSLTLTSDVLKSYQDAKRYLDDV